MRKRQKVLWKLFLSTLYLSAFTFGGGYVIVTLMKDKFVDKYHWIEENEMLDLIAIAQSAPGAIAVNGAIVVGYKLAGLAGVLTAIFGTVLPPFLIISAISVFYQMFRDNFIISELLDGMSLADITLHTGRTHQIRVQFASRRHPLWGDGKYGSRERGCTTALWSCRLAFFHPETHAPLVFEAAPPRIFPWDRFPWN